MKLKIKTAAHSFVIIFIIFIMMPQILAAGSGGGGSVKTPTCTEDTWSCTSWSKCQKDGTQSRTCTLVSDCSDAVTPKPDEIASCAYVSEILSSLKCYNLATMKERIGCRLSLADEELSKELKISYLPEECRALKNDAYKEDCIMLYSKSQPCWKLPIGPQRMSCLKHTLEIKNIKEEKLSCTNPSCFAGLRKKVYTLIKFRFYDLEERAEGLYEKGLISNEQEVEIITKLEEKKIEFNQANSKEQRKQIILEVKKVWRDFVLELSE